MTMRTGMTHDRSHEVYGTDQVPRDAGPGERYRERQPLLEMQTTFLRNRRHVIACRP